MSLVFPSVLVMLAGQPAPTPAAPLEPRAEAESFRREREARLRAPDGWLSLVGLHWLHPGENRFGGAPDDEVRMPPSVPAHAGKLFVDAGGVRVEIAPGVIATVGGKPLPAGARLPLRTDAGDAQPDIVTLGQATLQVIVRGDRVGARLKDPDSAARRRFAGLDWYPIAPAFRVTARLEAHEAPVKLVVPDASGGHQELVSPGTLTFTLGGHAQRLDPVVDGDDPGNLLVVFRDATSGRQTYGAGRFVRARRLPDASGGGWVLDFNQAYAPPCAFTPYATCPLPPPQNRLGLAVTAGERISGPHE
jgi:uncharacterized protein